MHFKFPEEFKSIFDHIGVRYYKALQKKINVELMCSKHVGEEYDMNKVKYILDNVSPPIHVLDMDQVESGGKEYFTTKQQLLDDLDRQGMNPKKQDDTAHVEKE